MSYFFKRDHQLDYLKVIGKKNLQGSVKISGAKNAALPLLASTILSYGGIADSSLNGIKREVTYPDTYVKIDDPAVN